MTNIKQLTELELKVLENFWYSADGNGHDFGFTDEHGIDPKQARGVIASLIKKKIIDVHEPIGGGDGIVQQFTWHGINPCDVKTIQDIIS